MTSRSPSEHVVIYRFYRCSMWYEEDPINASHETCAKLVHSTEIYSVLKNSQV